MSRTTVPTITRTTPTMTVTAPATARVTTSRTLSLSVSERTAQRSHRDFRPASHMGRSNHYEVIPYLYDRLGDTQCGAMTHAAAPAAIR
jgi:hypothetical protein